jgi:hypothetical protein
MESLMVLTLFKKSIYEIIKLLLILIFINHFFSCVWVLIARASINSNLVPDSMHRLGQLDALPLGRHFWGRVGGVH